VARPGVPKRPVETERAALGIIDGLAGRAAAGGSRLRWVASGQRADIRLVFGPRSVTGQRSQTQTGTRAGAGTGTGTRAGARVERQPTARLWVGLGNDPIRDTGPAANPSIRLDLPKADIEAQLLATLQRIAKAISLNRIAQRLPGADDGLTLDLRILPQPGAAPSRPPRTLSPEMIATPRAGDTLSLAVANHGDAALDINAFVIDAGYRITPIRMSADAHAIRLAPGERSETLTGTLTAGDGIALRQTEQLMVIAVEASPQRPPLDLGFLTQPGPPADRARARARARAGTGADDIMTLFESAGWGIAGRRGGLDPLHRRAGISSYFWRLPRSIAVTGQAATETAP